MARKTAAGPLLRQFCLGPGPLTPLRICCKRDEMEAVNFLLQKRGRDYTFLSGLDVLGEKVMDDLPVEISKTSEVQDDEDYEWILRASLINPESWWTSLIGE